MGTLTEKEKNTVSNITWRILPLKTYFGNIDENIGGMLTSNSYYYNNHKYLCCNSHYVCLILTIGSCKKWISCKKCIWLKSPIPKPVKCRVENCSKKKTNGCA